MLCQLLCDQIASQQYECSCDSSSFGCIISEEQLNCEQRGICKLRVLSL